MGSATEMEVHLDIAFTLRYISEQQHKHLIDEYQLIARKLYRLIEAWRKIDPSDLRTPTSDLGDEA
jgi:four helix bundle protein